MADGRGGGGLARILVIGAGVFGRLFASVARERGHEPLLAHRGSRTYPVDATRVASTVHAIRAAGAEALVHTAGPYQDQPPAAATAARDAGVPYVDLSDEAPFSRRVVAVADGTPLLTGMSTTPAVVDALIDRLLARLPRAVTLRVALFAGGGNRQGPATMAFAAHARAPGPMERVDFPGVGRRRAYPARIHSTRTDATPTMRGVVAVGGPAALGWASPTLVRWAPRVGPLLPRLSRDTAGSVVVDALDEEGDVVGREGVHARMDGQRIAVLPALWAVEEALGGRAPARAVLPRDWVEPDELLGYLAAHGMTRVTS